MALISRIGFTLFDRWGANLGRVPYVAASHTEALDGTDELKITCEREIAKGQRIVWVDRQGVPHEHIVDEVSRTHDGGGKTFCEAVCINSVNELWDDYIEDKRPSGDAAVALASILSDTRWEVGTCDTRSSASHTFYHISVREALTDLVSTWRGELETSIEIDGAGVTRRLIGVRSARGNQNSPKRFTWTKDIVNIKRTTGAANPKSRIYGYGKGVETEGGGFGRRLTFGDINDGKDYVEDKAATAVWGHPDGNGGIAPAVDVYINEQCEDAAQLYQETLDYLAKAKEPTVSYEASVLDLYAYGREWEGVCLGDYVSIIDKQFADDGIRLKGRVSQIERDLVTAETTVTFGNLVDAMADMWQTVATALKSGSASRANYDAIANPSAGWLATLQSALNERFNAVGTYKVESFEFGEIFSNVALNPKTGTPVKTSSNMWAVNFNGMGIRLASSLAANGQWDWTTFITGESVNADCINIGTMHANRVRAGLLTDEVGKNYWNLDTGEFQLSPADVKYGDGDWTLDGVVNDIDGRIGKTKNDVSQLWKDVSAKTDDLDKSIGDLDKTVDDLARDGIVTEAEKAAVTKILQTAQKDKEDLYAQYSSLSANENLSVQFKAAALTPMYDKAFGANGAYDALVSAISDVAECTTAAELETAMTAYKSAYDNYSTAAKDYASVARQATSMIAKSVAKADASALVDKLDNRLEQQEIFNRLTKDGQVQGIYMNGGKLYLNAEYLATGTISDVAGRNYWNLKTGDFKTTKGTIGGFTINYSTISNDTLSLRSNGPHFVHDGNDIGFIGTNGLTGYTNVHGLNFDLNETGDYMTWAAKKVASETAYSMKWTYANKSNIGFTAFALNAGCDIDMRNWSIKNIGNGCTNTLWLSVLRDVTKNGTYTFANDCKLEFEGGLLKHFTWGKGWYS